MNLPVCIDGDSLAKRAIMASAADDLKAGILPSGGIFGYLQSLVSILRSGRYSAGSVTVVFDQGIPAYRRTLLPDYKSARKARRAQWTPEEKERVYGQMGPIRDVTRLLGCNVVRFPDWEADDGLAAFAYRHGPGALVVSGDKDSFQVCQVGCQVFYTTAAELITPENFQQLVGVPAALYVLFKVLVGDTSDSIAGAPGCGPIRARSYLTASPEWPSDPHDQLDVFCRRILCTSPRRRWESEILRSKARLHATIDAVSFARAAEAYPAFPAPRAGVVDQQAVSDFFRHWRFVRLLAELPLIVPLFERQ